MCNAVCVGLAQFFGPIILAVALLAMVGAFVSAIRNTIAEDRRRNRAALEHKRRLRHDLTRPLIEVEQARHRLHEEDKSYVLDGDSSRKTWQMEYLDGIIAVRTWVREDLNKQFYPEQYRVFQELKRETERKAARQATFAAIKAHVRAWF